jgi:hypothetical protein
MISRTGTNAAIALTLAAAVCACSAGSVANQPLAAGQSIAKSAAMRRVHSDGAEARAFLQSHESTGDWETGAPVAGKPDEVKLSDGEIVDLPPGDASTAGCGFAGDVPPACTDAGAFRRFYSQPGASFMESTWDVSPATNLPTPPPRADAGYIYAEGWPASKLTVPSEAGFAYVSKKKWFYAYLRTAKGTMIDVQLYSVAAGKVSATYTGTCYTPAPDGNTACTAAMTTRAPGWNQHGCCIVASMVAIAEQPPGRNFTNGYVWGPADQVDCSSAQPPAVSGNCSVPGLMEAGQRYPNDASKVIVREPIFPGTESDTIDLHP